MTVDADTLRLVGALADPPRRGQAAEALANHLGAEALLIFVADGEVGDLLPVPGIPLAVPAEPAWRELLEQCRAAGIVRGTVPFPSTGKQVAALACAGAGAALVFAGGTPDETRVETLTALVGLLGIVFRAEHLLERQAASLAEARARAEESNRAKDELLAMLGHELRNPLAPIVTALQIMRLQGPSAREQEVLERQVAAVTRLVDDLLDVSRFAQGKVQLRKEQVELAAVAALAVETASPLLEQKHHELALEIPASGLVIDADPARLAQVFSNLLTNAAKYSDPRSRIRFTAERAGDRVVARVIDTGHGIEPHLLEVVFERFVQQRQSIDRSQGGLGLGLAIVKSLVALHGGSVRASSQGRGRGCEMIVELPASAGDLAAPQPLVGPGDRSLRIGAGGPRVLLVDDNEDAADLLGEALGNVGFDVRIAFDAVTALDVAQEFQPELALLDIGLPVMDGYELGQRLRELDGCGAMRLIALTGYGQASDEERSRAAGFDAHLVKPVDLRKLRHVLESLAPSR